MMPAVVVVQVEDAEVALQKNKAARILDDSKRGACGDISSRMKRSFVEQQYSSSTGMDKKE
jgi:hypothetical protein